MADVLGLRRGTVEVRQHHPEWTTRFDELQTSIMASTGLPPERVQHVGSTSVSGLPAKPIVDIDIGLVAGEDVEEVAVQLVEAGFIDRGHKGDGIGRLMVWETAPEVRTVHLHIIEYESRFWRQDITFRDALRSDVELRDAYAAYKSQLAARFAHDRTSYRHAKGPWIERALGDLMLEHL